MQQRNGQSEADKEMSGTDLRSKHYKPHPLTLASHVLGYPDFLNLSIFGKDLLKVIFPRGPVNV